MTRSARSLLLALLCAAATPGILHAQANVGEPGAPLFASHDPLEITVEADFDALEDDRGEERPERPGKLRYLAPDGQEIELDVGLRTRGNFRLRRTTCSFPNLRIRFDPADPRLAGTLFEGQRDLKLIGHCRGGDEFERNTLEEYLAYRLYNLVTDVSFRVRLVRFTYRDSADAGDAITRFGFLLEDLDALAARHGGIAIEVDAVNPLHLDGTASARLELFEYVIGNTDFSVVRSHNSEIVRLPDGTYQAVPYDFDFSGMVDAPYANPAPELGTRTVRERVYRGFCRPDVDSAALYDHFLQRRAAFHEILTGQGELDRRNAERAMSYVDEFYETIDSPRALHSLLQRRCREVPD